MSSRARLLPLQGLTPLIALLLSIAPSAHTQTSSGTPPTEAHQLTRIGTIPHQGETDSDGFLILPWGIDTDPMTKSILVADLNDGNLKVYEQEGAFVTSIGRPGQGPGEFDGPGKIAFADDAGLVFVSERVRFQVLTRAGVYQSSTRALAGKGVNDMVAIDSTRVAITLREPLRNGHYLAVLNKDSEIVRSFGAIDSALSWFPEQHAYRGWYGRSFLARAGDSLVAITGWLGTITVYDRNGKVLSYAEIQDPHADRVRSNNLSFMRGDVDGQPDEGTGLRYLVGGAWPNTESSFWVEISDAPMVHFYLCSTDGRVLRRLVWENPSERAHYEGFAYLKESGRERFYVADQLNAVIHVLAPVEDSRESP